jgi:hypothetical protein
MNRIEKALAPLASLRVQQRYIVDGTKNEYLIPEELLESAASALEGQAMTFELSTFKAALLACNLPENISASQLVSEYGPWCALRSAAKAYLLASGFDLEQWEAQEL